MASNPKPFLAAALRYGTDPKFDAWARKTYNVSGQALLAKVAKGESGFNMGAVSSAGARGGTQFMPGTRDEFVKRYGVDPWASPDAAIHATKLYLEHDKRGLAGYNPGDSSYTGYILGQKVGALGGGGGGQAQPPAQTTTTTTPGVDNSGARRQAAVGYFQQGGVKNTAATLALANTIAALKDIAPTTTTTRTPGASPSSGGSGRGGSKVLELIYNDGGNGYGIKDGRVVNGQQVFNAVWAGHADHVHVAAGPKTVVKLGKLAQKMGLNVGENPHFGGVDPVHVPGSYHYKGEAIDVSGDPALMKRFARAVERYNRTRKL